MGIVFIVRTRESALGLIYLHVYFRYVIEKGLEVRFILEQ